MNRFGSKSAFKVVSGGQTGVDRAALDAAIEMGMEHGGWCPEGRKAEDGLIDPRYNLQILPGAGYKRRTLANVRDCDGTVIIYFGLISGGTEQTLAYCLREGKPYKLIDAQEIPESRAAEIIKTFCEQFGIQTLNVAGPRASNEARAYPYTFLTIQLLLQSCA
ncbi:putative molybdenum carrier protein [Oleiphilus messinensis]|uniref:Putative molybdenum carrier protein n=1 Tax=Oleiphilus messinensis TaxID=141451 RepID=A0A1Y0IE80_9GAMM|nr:putative molybdenum carrier protein [Oleiphilus messinensis]ARU58086.1 putative molybdenum carrier protein [Oleiphilus messinensis]